MIYRTLLALTLLTISCQTHPAQGQYPKTKDFELRGVVVTMDRDSCFGRCPVYSLLIHGNGTVVYRGFKNVRVKGKRTNQIPKKEVARLVNDFYAIDFFSLKDGYTVIQNADGSTTFQTGLSGTTTTITIGSKTKSVYNLYGAPKALDELEREIDEISGSAKYVRAIRKMTAKKRQLAQKARCLFDL